MTTNDPILEQLLREFQDCWEDYRREVENTARLLIDATFIDLSAMEQQRLRERQAFHKYHTARSAFLEAIADKERNVATPSPPDLRRAA